MAREPVRLLAMALARVWARLRAQPLLASVKRQSRALVRAYPMAREPVGPLGMAPAQPAKAWARLRARPRLASVKLRPLALGQANLLVREPPRA